MKATQATEQDRLNSLYTKPGASTAAGAGPASTSLLSGESTGNQTFMDSLTKQISQATSAARKRIAALATASSYGGSFGGLGTTTPIAFAQGGNDINLQNAIRQGNLKTYGVQQQVQPLQYTVGEGTIQQQGIAKALGSIAGTLFGAGGTRAISDLSRGASAGVTTGLDPSFFSDAMTSFNDPIWNQWGSA
jgi:hypothetical protein